jgi:8-oxo-dGTP pyrophosphatase MutT (NUDIX family)
VILEPIDGPPATPRPAATVVLLRPGRAGFEVLLTRRPASMRFGANLFVFPGGRVDPGEAPIHAAVRETVEETGIVLDPTTLVAMSRWVTPPSMPIRYDTRFFATLVPPGVDVIRPSREVVEWRWLRPADALRAMAGALLAMWQPTVVSLQQLEAIADDRGLAAAFAERAGGPDAGPPADFPGSRVFAHRWAGGIEGRTGRTLVLGDRSWVVVDPGDPTGETTDAILDAADQAGAQLTGIVVTDLDPERHAGAAMLATGYDLPVAGPPGAAGLVPYAVAELADGSGLPFGDSGARVRVVTWPEAASDTPWASRAGRLALVPPRGGG